MSPSPISSPTKISFPNAKRKDRVETPSPPNKATKNSSSDTPHGREIGAASQTKNIQPSHNVRKQLFDEQVPQLIQEAKAGDVLQDVSFSSERYLYDSQSLYDSYVKLYQGKSKCFLRAFIPDNANPGAHREINGLILKAEDGKFLVANGDEDPEWHNTANFHFGKPLKADLILVLAGKKAFGELDDSRLAVDVTTLHKAKNAKQQLKSMMVNLEESVCDTLYEAHPELSRFAPRRGMPTPIHSSSASLPIHAPLPRRIPWNIIVMRDGERYQPNYPYPSPGGLGRYPAGGISPPPGGYPRGKRVEYMGVAYKTTFEEDAIRAATEQHERLVGPNRYGVESEFHTQTHDSDGKPLVVCIMKPGTSETGDIHIHPENGPPYHYRPDGHPYHYETNRLVSSAPNNAPNQYGESVSSGFCSGDSMKGKLTYRRFARVMSHVHVYSSRSQQMNQTHPYGQLLHFVPGLGDLNEAERLEYNFSTNAVNHDIGVNSMTFIVGSPGAPLKTPTLDGKTHAPMEWYRYDWFTRSCVMLQDKPESLRGHTPPPQRGFNAPDPRKFPAHPPFPPGPVEEPNPFGVSHSHGPLFDTNREW